MSVLMIQTIPNVMINLVSVIFEELGYDHRVISKAQTKCLKQQILEKKVNEIT